MQGVSVSTAAGLCSVVTCELKAKSRLFLGWCQWTETDTVIGIRVWNIPFRPWKVRSPLTCRPLWGQICACTMGSANHWTLTESLGEPHFTWALHRKTNAQKIIKKRICAFFVHYSVKFVLKKKTNNNQRYDFPGFWLCKSQLPINIPSNRNADVLKLCWRRNHEIEHLAKMPTCCAVGCENRTSNVLCGVFQNNSFSEYRQDLVCFNKTDVVCGSILQQEDWNATVVKEAHVCRVHLISGKLSFISPLKHETRAAESYFVVD